MVEKRPRDAFYWGPRLRRDAPKLSDKTKLRIIKNHLVNTSKITPEEADIFLAPKEELGDSERIMEFALVERKVARDYSGAYPENWDNREAYNTELRECLSEIYTQAEIDEILSHINTIRDAGTLTVFLAKNHYGWRRVRNAYLPEITDVIEIDYTNGTVQEITKRVLKEGADDTVSRIERLLGLE